MIRKLLTGCLLLIFFSTSVVGNLAWAQSLPAEIVITAKRLNVRDDIGGTKLGAVLRGQQFQLKSTKDNWGKIEFEPGRLGWISLQYTQQMVAQRSVSQHRAIRPVSLKLPAGEKVELYKGSYALVIGASEYQDNAWGDLSSVGEDVKAVRQALEGQGFQVQTVMDPTEDDLIEQINDFIDAHGYERDNRLLFYYSGHGYTQERNGRKFGYLVPVDAPNPNDNKKAFFRKSVKMEQILSWAKQIESKHAMFVFDSCFSGSVLQSRAVAVPEDISYSTTKPVRQFLSAGSADQTVPAISVFRPLFIRGIEGQADLDQDGYVTGVELGMYLQKQVPQYQTEQTPQYGKILDPYLDEGNFVFEVKKEQPKLQVQAAPPAVSSVELGDLEEQAEAAEQARLEQQRLEQASLEQKRIQTQWQQWQQRMQKDYDKVAAFEQQSIENKLKVESWERFLSSWKNDNPYTEQDKELRSKAQSRIIYWKNEIQEQKKEQQAVKKQKKPAARAQVTVLGWPGGPEETALRKAVEVYNAGPGKTNGTVSLIFFNRDGFWDKLQADLAAGTTEFDINLTPTYAVGRYAPYMQPLSLPSAASDVFGEKVLKAMQFKGEQFGVPTDLSLHFMYYRNDLIDKLLSDVGWQKIYGEISQKYLGKTLSPKNPDTWNWEDYAATALFFTKSVNSASPTRYGTVLQMKNLLFNIMIWHSTARSHGGEWLDAKGNVMVDSWAFRQGLQLYKTLYDAGASPKDSTSYEYAEANAAFGLGQAATMLQWNAAFGSLNNPEENPAVAGKIGTVAPPAGPAGRFTHIHGLGLGLNKNSKNKDAAIKFLNWLSGANAMETYALGGGSPAMAKSITHQISGDRPDLIKLGDFAGSYGFVMNGGTSASALQIYALQAEQFTGYWSGTKSLDEALQATSKGMAELLK